MKLPRDQEKGAADAIEPLPLPPLASYDRPRTAHSTASLSDSSSSRNTGGHANKRRRTVCESPIVDTAPVHPDSLAARITQYKCQLKTRE